MPPPNGNLVKLLGIVAFFSEQDYNGNEFVLGPPRGSWLTSPPWHSIFPCHLSTIEFVLGILLFVRDAEMADVLSAVSGFRGD